MPEGCAAAARALGCARSSVFRAQPHEGVPRRSFLHLAAGAALAVGTRPASPQDYPTRTVRLIVGFGAGGAPDILARLIGQWLSDRLGQSFIIENRPGASSNLA